MSVAILREKGGILIERVNKDTEATTCYRPGLRQSAARGQSWNKTLSAFSFYRHAFAIAINIVWRRYIPDGWWAKIGAHLATTIVQVLLCKGGQQPVNNALYRRCTVKAFGHFSPDALYKICGKIYAKATRGSLTYISAFNSGLDTTAITGLCCVFIYLFLHFFFFFFLLFTLFFYLFFRLGLCSSTAEEHWVAQAGG